MSHLRRLCSVVAASTLAVTGLTILVTAPAQAATAPRAVAQGADWLSGQLTNGLMQDRQYDFMLVSCPLNVEGGIASPPNAVAIK